MSNIRKLFQYLINILERVAPPITRYGSMSCSVPFMLPDRRVDEVEDPEAEASPENKLSTEYQQAVCVSSLSMIQHGFRFRKGFWAGREEIFVESVSVVSYIDMLVPWRIAGGATLLFVNAKTGVLEP
jgi:hypothetical protein